MTIILAIGIGTCVAGHEDNQQFQFIKTEFNNTLSQFASFEGFLNTENKKNLAWISYFLNGKYSAENTKQLIALFKAFRSASIKVDILTIQHETENTNFLIGNAISNLEAEKIKLQILFDLCTIYKNNKNKFALSNKDITKIVLKSLPEQLRFSLFASIILRFTILRFTETAKKVSWLKTFVSQDFYSNQPALAEEYLGLISTYNAFVLNNKDLNLTCFKMQVDTLINKLFAVETKNQYMTDIIELLTAKLIYIKNQAQALSAQSELTNQNNPKLKLFSKFKVLMLNKNFGRFALNKNFGHFFNLFTNNIQKYLTTNEPAQSNVAELFELEQLIKNLRDENLPKEPNVISKAFKIFNPGFKKEPLIIVLDEMLEIVTGAINTITKNDSLNGHTVLSNGINLINQLRGAGFDGTMLKDIAGAFLNQKFNTTQDAIMFIAAKTGPVWIKKVVPFLPDEIRGAASTALSLLVETKDSTAGLFEMLTPDESNLVA